MVSPNFVPNKGKRWEKSDSARDIINNAANGNTNKNRQISANRPMVFTPFVQTKAEKKKKKIKEKKVGAVSKKAA